MNETPDAGLASVPLTRRTVAKTAAWAAPAIALAAASPAHAASTERPAVILFDQDSYDVRLGGEVTITGKVIPASGQSIPADFEFNSTIPGAKGYGWTKPILNTTTGTFEILLNAYENATDGATLRVSSSNYPHYSPAETALNLTRASAGEVSGAIVFDQELYVVRRNTVVEITGTLVPTLGTTLPSDIVFKPFVAGTAGEGSGYKLVEGPFLEGDKFAMKVAADSTAAVGGVHLQLDNYPSYGYAAVGFSVNEPGYIDPSLGMLPIANSWTAVPGAGRDPSVRWFQATTRNVTSANLGENKPLFDLRFMLNQLTDRPDNFGTEPFGPANQTSGSLAGMGEPSFRMMAKVVSLTNNGIPQDTSSGIGLHIGKAGRSGPGSLGGRVLPSNSSRFWPTHDQTGAAITLNDKVYAFLPSGLPRGDGEVEIVATIKLPNGTESKMGFIITYKY